MEFTILYLIVVGASLAIRAMARDLLRSAIPQPEEVERVAAEYRDPR